MVHTQEEFTRIFNKMMTRTKRAEGRQYIRGRANLKLSLVLAGLSYICMIALLIRLNVDITVLGSMGMLALIMTIWLQHIVGHKDTRYYLTTFYNKKQNNEAFINKLLLNMKLNIKYKSPPDIKDAQQCIENMDLFRNVNPPPRYKFYNRISGVVGKSPYKLYNMSIHAAHNQKMRLFNGTLGVIHLDVSDHYYLRITPRLLMNDTHQERINYINTETLRIPAEHTEHILASTGYDIFTNDMMQTEHIICEQIQPYFDTMYDDKALSINNIKDPDTLNTVHRMIENLTAHRIETLIIKEQTLYVLLPYRNNKSHRKYPFDIKHDNKIDACVMWSDIEDALEKSNILHTITQNTNKT